MKTTTLFLAITALASLAGTTARANETHVSAGVTVGSYTNGSNYAAMPAPVYENGRGRDFSPARGHWENVTIKTWVPGRWVTTRDRWGRPHRVLENGYYAFRTDRVWVEDHRRGYGYNNWRN